MKLATLLQTSCHWVIAASISTPTIKGKRQWLSENEQQRADRFRREEDQQRYTLAHMLKRYCLSHLLNVATHELTFLEGEKGKPFCNNTDAPFFNISHSGDWVFVGFSSIADIGVDVELLGRDVSDAVAEYALTPEQLNNVKNANNRSERFMAYWTQKESISKALGLGLSIDFQTVKCSGSLGDSVSEHSGQALHISSRLLGQYIFSVASTRAEPIPFYQLTHWADSDASLKTF